MNAWTVFVSYSRDDRPLVEPLTRLMRITGTTVFRDEDSIAPGKKWKLQLAETIAKATTVVVFWSKKSSESQMVREEFELAISGEKDVVPILLDDTPLNSQLGEYQWLDFRPLVADLGKRASMAGSAGAGAAIGSILLPQIGVLMGTMLGKLIADAKIDDELQTLVYNRVIPERMR